MVFVDDILSITNLEVLASINNILYMWFYAWLMMEIMRCVIRNLRGAFKNKKWKH